MYRRSYYRGRAGKYSNETIAVNAQSTADLDSGESMTEEPITIVPATSVYGNRKAKNFTLRFTAKNTDDTIIGVLAYVPEGTTMSAPTVTGINQSLYEPNQNVIASFIIPPSCRRNLDGSIAEDNSSSPVVVSTRLARNLNTGDAIQLALITPNGMHAGDGTQGVEPAIVCGTINYSIKY